MRPTDMLIRALMALFILSVALLVFLTYAIDRSIADAHKDAASLQPVWTSDTIP